MAAEDQKRLEYQWRRNGHDHEWTILISRQAAYLASQGLFATSAAFLENSNSPEGKNNNPILFIAIVGLLISILSSVSITINCRVILEWHRYIQALINEDHNKYLSGMYLSRSQPDWMHRLSVDVFCIGISLIGIFGWTVIIVNHYHKYTIISVILITAWLMFLGWIYFLSKIPGGENIPKYSRLARKKNY